MLAEGGARLADLWMHCIRLERIAETSSEAIRKLFLRALNSTQDDPESIMAEFLQSERANGTIDTLRTAHERIRARRAQLETQLAAQRARASVTGSNRQRKGKQYDGKQYDGKQYDGKQNAPCDASSS